MDLIASFLVKALNVFFHIMPIHFNLWLGRRLGTAVYLLSGKRSSIAYSNLKAAFCRDKTPKELRRIVGNMYKNIAQTFVEILSLTKMDASYINKFVDGDTVYRLGEAFNNPKGVIFVSAHFGNWELSTIVSSLNGYPLYLLARDQKMERLNELLNRLREMKGNTVIRKGSDIKNIFRVLKEGHNVGILADQNAGPTGELLDLFGRPASTASGPYRFAQKTGASMLIAFMVRKKGPYHTLTIEEPVMIKKGEDVVPYMQKYNQLLEKYVREYPDQWLWMHKKWKMTPVKKIMVLDDGKKGHLKQSLAVVKQIRRHREDKGYASEHTELDVVKIQFKSKIAKAIFNSLAPRFTSHCQGCLKCLKMALNEESYENAVSRYADVIVSCGSTLFAVNKLLKVENYARNLTVLDPGYLNRKAFDLIVVPRHDVSRPKGNMVVTELAPNLIEPEEGRKSQEKPCIGLLFGGDNPHFTFGEELTRSIAEEIKKVCGKIGAQLYATTSRRTREVSERILKDAFINKPECLEFISGKDDKDEHTVEKILAGSDVILVSGESISMVSEAVSSGKPVLVFMPDKKVKKVTKYERFTEGLKQRGYVKCVKPENIAEEIEKAMSDKQRATIALPDDNERIYKEAHRLF